MNFHVSTILIAIILITAIHRIFNEYPPRIAWMQQREHERTLIHPDHGIAPSTIRVTPYVLTTDPFFHVENNEPTTMRRRSGGQPHTIHVYRKRQPITRQPNIRTLPVEEVS